MSRLTIPRSSVVMCKEPEWSDTDYFINISIVKRKGEDFVLCEGEQSEEESEEESNGRDSEAREAVEGKAPSEEKSLPNETRPDTSKERPLPAQLKPETPKVRSHSTEKKPEDTKEKWQSIIQFMMNKFSEASDKQRAALELQNVNMTEAISLIERMTIWPKKTIR